MSETTNTPDFFEKAFDSAKSWVEKELGIVENTIVPIEQSIAKFGNAVVNEYKKIASNPEVASFAEWFVKIAEGIDPLLTPLISGIELAFPKIVNVATGVLGEIAKPVGQQLGDGLTAIENIKLANGTIGSNVLGGISAAVVNFVATNNATTVTVPTDSQAIVAAHLVHAQAA